MTIDVAKVRRRLPAPPVEGTPALEAPVSVPAEAARVTVQPGTPTKPRTSARQPKAAAPGKPAHRHRAQGAAPKDAPVRLDGRSLRATGRVVQLNLKVSGDTKDRFIRLAAEHGVLMAALFERMVEIIEDEPEMFRQTRGGR